ncbi:FG-GAP-like repeat-containing protein [Streptomyces lavendulocolor]|uniref:FG-GAP-like repeat-containing protein n=1 Tax=Streptomyces lavendulocolor TaxID=67316 RepID=UPI003C2EE777
MTGPKVVGRGTAQVLGGRTAHRDANGDGLGEYYSMTTGGKFAAHRIGATGGDWSSSPWDPATRFIPFGDMDGDGCDDMLLRSTDGRLWRYGGTGQGTFKPRHLLFEDWGAGRIEIIGVGDISGDGVPDLLSRDTNGKLLRNKGDGKGSFGATLTIATGWQNYRSLY